MIAVIRPAPLVAVLLVASCLFAGPAIGAPLPPQIHTVAGGGSCTTTTRNPDPTVIAPLVLPCENMAATSVPIGDASAVAALPGGGFLYVDPIYDEVREVSASGQVTTVAGNGTSTDMDGVAATASGLNNPVSVAPLPAGGFLVTEYAGSVVRMVSLGAPGTATITTIAGTGTPGRGALSGPATSIALSYPSQAVPTADGGVLIADTGNDYVRLLSAASTGATMSTIAGGGFAGGGSLCDDTGTSCEGMSADAVALHDPVSVSPLQDGSGGYLIAEDHYSGANAVREVSQMSPSGTFTTVAGIPGQPGGYGGDGGAATSALLNLPGEVLSTSDGGFLIADTNNERIRQISPSGMITTIAGNGVASYAGDGGAAAAASLDAPAGVSPTTGGGLLIADADDGAIREITNPPVSTITLSPAQPNGRGGWYVSTPLAQVSTPTATTTRCEVDPASPPPVYDALPATPCPFTGSGALVTGQGTHTVYAASINAFGDKELPVSVTFQVDSILPTVTCSKTPIFPFGARKEMVSATVADPGGSGPATPLASTPAVTSTAGSHQAYMVGSDNAGNFTFGTTCPYIVLAPTLRPAPVLTDVFAPKRSYSTVKRLVVTDVPGGAAVGVACRGKGCPFSDRQNVGEQQCKKGHPCKLKKPSPSAKPRAVDLQPLFARSRLPVGVQLTISVTKANAIGRVFLVTIRARQAPLYSVSCLAPGSSTPGKGC